MRKILFFATVFVLVVFLQNCKSAKSKYIAPAAITYNKDIVPIMQNSCTPCHFPPEGKKEPLNSYETVKSHISEIITSVKLPQDNKKFMPFRNKKPALTESQIAVLENWQKQGMLQ